MKRLTNKQEESFELINCISWLAMDASWMFNIPIGCYLFLIPTLFAGIVLTLKSHPNTLRVANAGILSWSLMNMLWMLSEILAQPELLKVAYGFFFLGAGIITFTIYSSPHMKKGLVKRVQILRNISKNE